MNIKTANGFTAIKPVFCEMTGRQICWQTILPEGAIEKGCTPAYFSFKVISDLGLVKMKEELLEIETC